MSFLDGIFDGTGIATALATTGSPVRVSGAAPPQVGHVLTAIDSETAEWSPQDMIDETVREDLAAHIGSVGTEAHGLVSSDGAGFMSFADKQKLDGIASGATSLELASSEPENVGEDPVTGIADTAARADHVHAHGNLPGGSLHAVASGDGSGFMSVADKLKLDGIESGATAIDLSDEQPNDVAFDSDPGASEEAARADHVHAHGNLEGGLLHQLVGVESAGFMSTADKFKLDGIAAGATATILSDDPPWVVVGNGGADPGTSNEAARSDHAHEHGNQAGGALHAVATMGANGFLSSADKTKLDALAAGQNATVGRLTVDAILETPSTPAYASTLNLDVATKNDFAVGVLTGNVAITLTNPAAGRQGLVAVRQDATGGRTVSFAASGWTVYRDSNVVDLAAASGANAVTLYTYAMITVGGLNMLLVGKLIPVAA